MKSVRSSILCEAQNSVTSHPTSYRRTVPEGDTCDSVAPSLTRLTPQPHRNEGVWKVEVELHALLTPAIAGLVLHQQKRLLVQWVGPTAGDETNTKVSEGKAAFIFSIVNWRRRQSLHPKPWCLSAALHSVVFKEMTSQSAQWMRLTSRHTLRFKAVLSVQMKKRDYVSSEWTCLQCVMRCKWYFLFIINGMSDVWQLVYWKEQIECRV